MPFRRIPSLRRRAASTAAQVVPFVPPPPPPGFDPSIYPGLILDLDANDASTMSLLLDGSGPDILDAERVRNWRDQDSNGVVFKLHGGDTARPTYRSSISGQPALEFPTSKYLATLDTSEGDIQVGVSDYTIYTVIRPIGAGASHYLSDALTGRLLLATGSGGGNDGLAYFNNGVWRQQPNGDPLLAALDYITTWVLQDPNDGEMLRQRGGTNVSLVSGLPYTQVALDGTTGIGGRYNSGAQNVDAYIRQHLIYNQVHSAGDQTSVRTGLADKWSGLGL